MSSPTKKTLKHKLKSLIDNLHPPYLLMYVQQDILEFGLSRSLPVRTTVVGVSWLTGSYAV